MGILDGIVEWIAEQIMYGLDMINTSVLGALGCDMNTFLRYFPAAETMYSLLVALAIGLILLGWVWNLFKNYGLGLGIEAEDPVRLTAKAILFIVLAYYADEIVNIALTIGGTPYAWILSSELPSLDFASFNSVLLTIIGVCANGGVALIVLILTLILAWNYIKCRAAGSKRCSSGKADAQRKRFSKVADGRDPSASRFQYPNRLGFLTPQGVAAFRWPRRAYFYQFHAGGRTFCQRCNRYGRSRRPALHRLHHRRVCVTGVILLHGHYRSGRRRAANILFQH